ncbi:hypothetical protein LOS78_12715 [Paracoccus sp. MA]|uniref:hypothetical protein n=1 Tax=Paracoccus sp. MA TaxID=2895796 RepID=UPI001E41D96E|nr:hypothetical protein [Paracoccus sp. MA]UFM66788.1 hypothetical protein LOS78_12715 [Paracoccus sp. MA]
MSIIEQLTNAPAGRCIHDQVRARLTGRALYCGINAWNFLIRAEAVKHVPTVSYFCASHSTEEAVAAFLWSARAHGYKDLAKDISPRDHKHKAVVSEFASMIADEAGRAGISFTYHPKKDDLFARVKIEGEFQYRHLNLGLISYNKDEGDTDPDAAEGAFMSTYPGDIEMVRALERKADFRNQALYAGKEGAPSMTPEALERQLRYHGVITLGLLWAASDMSRHDGERVPFVVQSLGAMNRICQRMSKKRCSSSNDG